VLPVRGRLTFAYTLSGMLAQLGGSGPYSRHRRARGSPS
jgi:hypothetical protein